MTYPNHDRSTSPVRSSLGCYSENCTSARTIKGWLAWPGCATTWTSLIAPVLTRTLALVLPLIVGFNAYYSNSKIQLEQRVRRKSRLDCDLPYIRKVMTGQTARSLLPTSDACSQDWRWRKRFDQNIASSPMIRRLRTTCGTGRRQGNA